MGPVGVGGDSCPAGPGTAALGWEVNTDRPAGRGEPSSGADPPLHPRTPGSH